MSVDCRYKEKCSGCHYLGEAIEVQHQRKIRELENLFAGISLPAPAVQMLSAGEAHLRDRSDFVYEKGRWGLYEKTSREILDIEVCQQFSPRLQEWLTDVRQRSWPVEKGSFRLRVSPSGQRGLWLDFANIDIKNLLLEKTLLQELQELAFVEMGQRHKVPFLKDSEYKLGPAELHPWFHTWIQGQEIPLFCHVGSFTQPSLAANRLLIQVIESWLDQMGVRRVLEFGSGIGNLSFPALGKNRELVACEIDAAALEGFQRSLEAAEQRPGLAGLSKRVHLLRGDFQHQPKVSFGDVDAVLANPPRSGLKDFLKPLLEGARSPKYFIYMSCFPESLIFDARHLRELGYRLQELKIVDQFPQTSHYEVLSLWSL